ncbi:MAG: hemolysin III family protein [Planctomycetaceae bacterium]|nr:hemolysin III family protein [Planctomycetales bacterium]MCB9873718.1 hemolysin III family protein [Planctomycetaceae bacterium]MCB9938147.1 hemolysin III family protein [Planctomycetaceae bacterium]
MATDSTIYDALPERSRADEFANTVTHGMGILLSLVGAAFMIPATHASSLKVQVAVVAYLASLVAVYGFSTLSHAVHSITEKNRLRAWDQGTIYLLIVGTYTPFVAAFLPPLEAAVIAAVLWLAAGFGFWSKVVANHRINKFASWSYIALGWFPAMAFIGRVPFDVVKWMAYGGISYTVGTIFLALDHRVAYFHAIWHILVIAASACHYYAIFTYVIA